MIIFFRVLAFFGLFFSFFIADAFLRMIQFHQRGSVIVGYDYSLFDIITSPEYLLGSLAILASLAVYPLLFFFIRWSREILVVLLGLYFLGETVGSIGHYELIGKSGFTDNLGIFEYICGLLLAAMSYFAPVINDKFKTDKQ